MIELFQKILTNKECIKDKSIFFMTEKMPTIQAKYIGILGEFVDILINAMIKFDQDGRKESCSVFQEIIEYCIIQIKRDYKVGIKVEYLLAILKCYKKAFIGSLNDSHDRFFCDKEHLLFIADFFDMVELTAVRELSKASQLEMKFNTLTQISSALIFITDGAKFTYVNPAVEAFSGYTNEEIYSAGLMEYVHTESRKQLRELIEKKVPRDEKVTIEVKVIIKNGEERWLQVSCGMLPMDQKVYYIGIALDITEKKLSEIKLRKSEALYRGLLGCVPDAVVVHTHGAICYANQAAVNMLGLGSAEEWLGKKVMSFVQPDQDSKQVLRDAISLLRDNGVMFIPSVNLIRMRDNKLIQCEVTASKTIEDEECSALFILKDSEERKKKEELICQVREKTKQLNETIEYNKIRTEFFANISHELRTPLNVITSSLQFLELLDKEGKTDLIKEKLHIYTTMMKNNCFRLSRMINNIIDMSQIGNGYSDIMLENGDIVKVIEDITILCTEYAGKRGINLIFDTDTEECLMAFDQDKIERIILNLLSNSLKFTKPGGNIFVNIYNKAGSVDISVRDDGIGIPHSKQNEIFDVFVQVDKSFTRCSEGSGMGLSIVKALVEMHKGSIRINSEEYRGTEITISIPITCVPSKDSIFDLEEYNTSSCKDRILMEFSDIYEF